MGRKLTQGDQREDTMKILKFCDLGQTAEG